MKLLALALAFAACSSSDSTPDRTGTVTPMKQPDEVGNSPKPPIALTTTDLPDDSWRRPANLAASNWHESFSKLKLKSVKVSPFRSPGGAAVPYLLYVEASDAAGAVVFKSTALIYKDRMLNGAGPKYLAPYLADLGFPRTTKITTGHLVEIVYLAGILKPDWLNPPSKGGWDQFDKPVAMLGTVSAALDYGGGGAVLTVYRSGKPTGTERIVLTFSPDGTFTQQASRRASDTASWEPFTP